MNLKSAKRTQNSVNPDQKWKKRFFFIGFPLLLFMLFIINIYFAFISGILSIALILGLSSIRKQHLWERLNKISFSLFICFLILVSNPLMWFQQFDRHIHQDKIITPQAHAVSRLNKTSTEDGLWDWLNTNKSISIAQYEAKAQAEQIRLIEEYFLWKIEWTMIQNQYGVIKRLATPTEAITSERGDCQAQSCAMVSFLIHLGFNAYACETPFHWYVKVYLNNGSELFLYRIIDDSFRCSDPEVLINHEEILYTMKSPQLLWDIIIDDHMNENTFLPALKEIGVFIGFIFGFPILGGLIVFFEMRTRKIPLKTAKRTILGGMGMMFGGVLAMRFVPLLIPKTTTLFMLLSILTVIQYASLMLREKSNK